MKERPIIFSSEMVKAILDGRKTQTRRVIKPQPPDEYDLARYVKYAGCVAAQFENPVDSSGPLGMWTKRCPYGQPGDRLYVRETWAQCMFSGENMYRADNIGLPSPEGGWRPSIFMPKQLSRIWLEIIDVRVERVRDIGTADILAEGVKPDYEFATHSNFERGGGGGGIRDLMVKTGPGQAKTVRTCFHELWDRINKKRGHGWDKNPWVWVIEFKTINKEERNEKRT